MYYHLMISYTTHYTIIQLPVAVIVTRHMMNIIHLTSSQNFYGKHSFLVTLTMFICTISHWEQRLVCTVVIQHFGKKKVLHQPV